VVLLGEQPDCEDARDTKVINGSLARASTLMHLRSVRRRVVP
jgi:hypothetical protein